MLDVIEILKSIVDIVLLIAVEHMLFLDEIINGVIVW